MGEFASLEKDMLLIILCVIIFDLLIWYGMMF